LDRLHPLHRHVLAGHADLRPDRRGLHGRPVDRPRRAPRAGRHRRARRRVAGAAHQPLPDQGPAARRDPARGELVAMAETDNPKNTRLLAMVVGTTASLIVVVLAIVQYFDMSVRTEVYEKVLSQPNSVLRDLRAMEANKLSRYAWVDQKA